MSSQQIRRLLASEYSGLFGDTYEENKLVTVNLNEDGTIVVNNKLSPDDLMNVSSSSANDKSANAKTNSGNSKNNSASSVSNNAAVNLQQSCTKIDLASFMAPHTGYTFIKSSVNCVHTTIDETFYKLQAFNYGDSLVGETYYTEVLQAFKALNIFPIIQNAPPSYGKIIITKNDKTIAIQGLKTVAYKNPVSLGAKLREGNHETILVDIRKLLTSYLDYVKHFGELSHNDLHLNNMLYDDGKLKFIDLGRMYMSGVYPDILKKVCKAFCLPVALNATSLQPATNMHHLTNQFQLKGPRSYLCDVTTVALNVLPVIAAYDWPKWCQYKVVGMSGIITINYALLCESNVSLANGDILQIGLAWLVCCIIAYNATNKLDLDYNASYDFELNALRNNTLMFKNSVFIGTFYDMYKSMATSFFNNACLRTLGSSGRKKQQSGGGRTEMSEAYISACLDNACLPTGKLICDFLATPRRLPPHTLPHLAAVSPLKTQSAVHMPVVPVQTVVAATTAGPAAAGGSSPKTKYQVCQDKATGRKYIRRQRARWYLDEHRGAYRWASEEKKYIHIAGKKNRL